MNKNRKKALGFYRPPDGAAYVQYMHCTPVYRDPANKKLMILDHIKSLQC